MHHFRYFLSVATLLSFSRSAESLGISQPALSRQIRDLERELGAPLFNREGRTNSLTAAGQAFLPAATAALAEAERGRRSVRDVIGGQGGTLIVGSSPQTAATVLAPRLRAFSLEFPGIIVRIVEDGAMTLIEGLENGGLDLAVVPLDIPATLSVRPFLTAHIQAIAPRAHPLVQEPSVDLRNLVAAAGKRPIPLLLLKERYLTRVRLTAAWHEAGMVPYVAMESAVGQTLAAYAEAGLGVALLPDTVDLRGFDLGRATVCDRNEPIVLNNGMGWNPRRYQSPAALAFVERTCGHESAGSRRGVMRSAIAKTDNRRPFAR